MGGPPRSWQPPAKILLSFIDAIPTHAGVLSPGGVVLFANRAALDAGGLHLPDVVGVPLWETGWWLPGGAAQQRLREAIGRAAEGEQARYEVDLRASPHGRITLDLRLTPITVRGRVEHIVWSGVDVTELRSLEEAREEMAALVEHTPDFVATTTPGGRLLSLNLSGRRLLGMGPEDEVVGREMAEFYPPWAKTLIEEVARPAARGKGSWAGRCALLDPEGREIPTSLVIIAHKDDSGEVRYFSKVARDATEERRSENRLKTEVVIGEALEGSASLAKAIPEILQAIVQILGADLAEFWEPAENESNLRREAFIEGSPGTGGWFPPGESSEPGSMPLHERMALGGSPVLVLPGLTLDAQKREIQLPSWASSALGFAVGVEDVVVGVVTAYWQDDLQDVAIRSSAGRIARDIAAFVRREQADASLRRARTIAEEASRAKDEFLANMSHEIRSPMTAILGYVEILAKSISDPDDVQVLDTIRKNGRHLLDLVSDILDLAKIEAGRVEMDRKSMSPSGTVAEVMGLMTLRAAEKGLSFSARFDTPIPDRIFSDPVRIRQVLVNLTGNAIKFTPHGSVELRIAKREEKIEFRVDDTGIGVPEERIHQLFEPFAQLSTASHREHGGTGLGLAICRRLASALEGSLRAESVPGRGSSFFFSVPIGTEEYSLLEPEELTRELGREPETGPHRTAPSGLRGRVLAVDDRLDMRILLTHLFEDAGMEIVTASDGMNALSFYEVSISENRPFDLIVMDVQMPGMDGFTSASELRKRGFKGPIFALTAGARSTDQQRAISAGCDEYLAKPISGPDLLELVARYLNLEEDSGGDQPDFDGCAVLLVEDDPDVAAVMATLLTTWGCTVRTAHSAREALDQAKSVRVDVLFSDLTLPDLPGTELLPEIRKLDTCRDAICVSLSGHGGPEGEAISKRAGFERHLVKPSSTEQLRAVLRRARASR